MGIERPSSRAEVPQAPPAVDQDGNPLPGGQRLDQDWIDRVTGRDPRDAPPPRQLPRYREEVPPPPSDDRPNQ